MVCIPTFVRLLGTLTFVVVTTQQTASPATSKELVGLVGLAKGYFGKPFYAIAHRVLTKGGITAAMDHGANAVEMDMTAWDEGWWADHDGSREKKSWGDTAEDMFKEVAAQMKDGKRILFVWLDLKNADYRDLDDKKWEGCSIKGLQGLARKHLEPAGVRVLYGFMKAEGKAFGYIKGKLNEHEAINLDGRPGQTISKLNPVPQAQKVASYGDTDIEKGFGACGEPDTQTYTALRQAEESKKWGKVFGWTVTEGDHDFVEKLVGRAKVDGVIYGFKTSYYRDEPRAKNAASDVTDTAQKDRRNHMAFQAPW